MTNDLNRPEGSGNSLLDMAKAHIPKRRPGRGSICDPQLLELALAYARHEITATAAKAALAVAEGRVKSSGNAVTRMGGALMKAARDGVVVVEIVVPKVKGEGDKQHGES